MAIRILIVDDHQVFRQGLRLLLQSASEIEVIGEAADGDEAVRLAQQLRPDLVLMDLMLPELDGIAATTAIRNDLPQTKVLILTGVPEDHGVVQAVRAGAIGYVPKDVDASDLRRAIKAAMAGQFQLSTRAAGRLAREVHEARTSELLTDRETRILSLLVHGLANKEIARGLGIAETTVKSHVRHVLAKLGVSSRTQAALVAVRDGLVTTSGTEVIDSVDFDAPVAPPAASAMGNGHRLAKAAEPLRIHSGDHCQPTGRAANASGRFLVRAIG
jgi:NarL family two-component system response regulator LiaR